MATVAISCSLGRLMMSTQFSVYIAASVDGFIARKNGKLDWLNDAASGEKNKQDTAIKSNAEDYGYQKFITSVDCIVMGRNSFEKAASFSEWPYPFKKVFVLSKTLKTVPAEFEDKVTLTSQSVEELAIELQNCGYKHVYVDGGKTIQSFIRTEFIDQIILTQIPLLLGNGIPLFADVVKDVKLKLVSSKSYSNGFVQSRYQVLRYSAKYFD
jgi:dihydrofolate reductase